MKIQGVICNFNMPPWNIYNGMTGHTILIIYMNKYINILRSLWQIGILEKPILHIQVYMVGRTMFIVIPSFYQTGEVGRSASFNIGKILFIDRGYHGEDIDR